MIKVQEEEEVVPTIVQEEAKEKNEKEAEAKSTLEVELLVISRPHSYGLHRHNLRVEVKITEKALFSFLMTKSEMRPCMRCFY